MKLLGFFLYMVLGAVLSELGHSWKSGGFWLILGLVVVIDVLSHINARMQE